MDEFNYARSDAIIASFYSYATTIVKHMHMFQSCITSRTNKAYLREQNSVNVNKKTFART